jgi:hypothetical protein
VTRFELLERAYEVVPRDLLRPRLFEGMRQVALRLADRGVTRLYPPLLSVDRR